MAKSSNKSKTAKVSDSKTDNKQALINMKLFHAIEQLGYKVKNSQDEHGFILDRIDDVEEQTKNLPMILDNNLGAVSSSRNTPKWLVAISCLSLLIAIFSFTTMIIAQNKLGNIEAIQMAKSIPEVIDGKIQYLDKTVLPNVDVADVKQEELKIDLVRDETLPEALKELEDRSYNGDVEAWHDLAVAYSSGSLIAINFERAKYWFEKSSKMGIANSDYNLGVMYHQGLGVDKDIGSAIEWYEKAAAKEHPEALYNLAVINIEGTGVDVNIDKGVDYFKESAKLGITQASFNLGVLYETVLTARENHMDMALSWYNNASNLGHNESLLAVNRINDAIKNNKLAGEINMLEPLAGEELVGQGDASLNIIEDSDHIDIVTGIQDILISVNMLPKDIEKGYMDSKTSNAIMDYQEKYEIMKTGLPSIELLDYMIDNVIAGSK